MGSERTTINLRGYCLYCLGKLGDDGSYAESNSPACSPLKFPFGKRHLNVQNVPVEERLAPFTVLCRYLGIDLPDCYAFGDEADTETLSLTPPLCTRCHEMSARLCFLQDELQNIHAKINNVTKRIYQRVTNTCDRHGALKREAFEQEFRNKSKSSLSRGRGENLKTKKVTQLVKSFQMKIIEKETETKSCELSLISSQQHDPFIPMELELENTENEFDPILPSETLRSKWNENLHLLPECQKEECAKSTSELTTMLCQYDDDPDSQNLVPTRDTLSFDLVNTEVLQEPMPLSEISIPNKQCRMRMVTRSQAMKLKGQS
ncbi:unnamed protein product [Orchesella dallaii]|uniref:Uncharacterized protein n=1 Tax=Orchesella dallaii TaxID=48710 RepID=A0ABP1S5Z4_9HEXA